MAAEGVSKLVVAPWEGGVCGIEGESSRGCAMRCWFCDILMIFMMLPFFPLGESDAREADKLLTLANI